MKVTTSMLLVFGSIILTGCSSGGGSTVTPPANVVKQESVPDEQTQTPDEQTQTPDEQTQTTQTITPSSVISLSTDKTLWERFDTLGLGETLEIPAVSRQKTYTIENGQVIFGEDSGAETGALLSYTVGLDPVTEPLTLTATSATGTKVVFEEIDDPNNSTFRIVDVPFVTEYDRNPRTEFGNSPYAFEFTEVTDGARDLLFVTQDADQTGWNYQTYGVWITGFGGGSGTVGAASGGAVTPGANIPTSGNATFTGISTGIFLDSAGDAFLAQSTMEANASFSNRTVSFATSNTHVTPLASSVNALIATPSVAQPFTTTPGLNLSGTMSYAAGENKLSGAVSSVNGMTGVVDANFYGPVANEIGGSFAVKGTAGNYMGAFGGRP